MNPKYPIYIPSKGRWESRLTSKSLEAIGVPYKIVIEEGEYDKYAAVIDPKKILVLPFSGKGLVPSRNWIKEHSLSIGAERHWQLDDNINGFYRFNRNFKVPVGSGTILRVAEEFVDRYENVAFSGFNYFMFARRKDANIPPLYLNTRIYSCTLVNNKYKYRWRGVYNDDTDISLRALKDGLCTVLFNAFLCWKMTTMTIDGGNTPIYQKDENGDGRLRMAQSLVDQHPDVTRIIWRFNRWQHYVDYTPFKANKLILKEGIEVPKGVNNFGMVFREGYSSLPHTESGESEAIEQSIENGENEIEDEALEENAL